MMHAVLRKLGLSAITMILGLGVIHWAPVWVGPVTSNAATTQTAAIYLSIGLLSFVGFVTFIRLMWQARKTIISLQTLLLLFVLLAYPYTLLLGATFSPMGGITFGEPPIFCETYTVSETVQQHHCIRATEPDACVGVPQWRYIYNTREGWPIMWMVESEFYFGGLRPLRDDCMF